MEEQFVPYELSVKLEELGLEFKPFGYYASFYAIQEPKLFKEYKEEFEDYNILIPAPLWQQAFKFIISIVNLEFDYNKEYVIGFYGEFYLELHKWEDYEGVNIQPVCEGNSKVLEYLIKLADKNN